MKKIALVLGSLIILTILGQDVFAEGNCPKYSTYLELEYNIHGGIVNSICKDNDTNALLLNIESNSDGQLVIEIPRMIIDVAIDCTKDDRFFVLIDGIEQEEKKFSDPIKYVLTIDFSKGSSSIEIIGLMVGGLTDTEKKLCIKERLQKYPPKQQLDFGVSNTGVICKDGLQLIFKSTDGSPACVKSKTAEKLIERGWAVFSINQVWFDSSQIRYEDIDFKIHKKLLMTHYKNEGITILDVRYDLFNEVQFGEYCEGSFREYNVALLISESDNERIKNVDLPSYFPEADLCTGLP